MNGPAPAPAAPAQGLAGAGYEGPMADPDVDRARGFARILAYGALVAFLVAVLDGAVYAAAGAREYLVFSALALLALASVGMSSLLVRRGHLEAGIALSLAYLLLVAPVGPALIQSRALLSVSLPFIVMAVAMSYASVRFLKFYGVASWLSAVAVLALWQWHGVSAGTVTTGLGAANVLTAAVVVAFTFYALSRYSQRLSLAVDGMRTANRDLLKAHDRLKDEDAARVRLMNIAAHELNTPMTPIRLQLKLLEKSAGVQADARAQRGVEILERNFARLRRLSSDILDGARLDAGRLEVQHVGLDLSRLLAEAVEEYARAAHAAGRRLIGRIAPGLHVIGDPVRLRQVVDNLISNALKFTNEAGRVEVVAVRHDDSARVLVRDDGIGIAPEAIPRLFQPFLQVHDPSKVAGGSGMGLYLSRGIMERMAGTVEIASEGLGRGTTLTLSMPLALAPAEPGMDPPATLEEEAEPEMRLDAAP